MTKKQALQSYYQLQNIARLFAKAGCVAQEATTLKLASNIVEIFCLTETEIIQGIE